MDIHTAHEIASQAFINLKLSYTYISKLVPRSEFSQVISNGELGKASSSPSTCYAPAASASEDGWAPIAGSTDTLVKFSFSKPTVEDPRPAVVVEMGLEFIAYNTSTNTWRYLVRVEGQRYNRLMEVSGEADKVTGKEFSEKWIDKVFLQKQAAYGKMLWKK